MMTDQMKIPPPQTLAVGNRCVSNTAGYALTVGDELAPWHMKQDCDCDKT